MGGLLLAKTIIVAAVFYVIALIFTLPILCFQFIQTGITDCFKGDKHRFELWSKGREQTFIFQCGTVELKDIWVKQMSQLLVSHYGEIFFRTVSL